ncbi:hypothetical protein AVEN_193861-1 [Araneus ventricosus]|uniref:Uncharacterized protein n=1 Tax=Araneus ventricosus TaxID=182803 RepID=A0A4Y2SNF5_ARAVE|nr:hypothetical protein AVEN_37340-1 [Araneus ventricosus]GBN88625.1 hypothetical protein AVEN_193861-1 [Araneus ventricosus]
MKHLNNKRKSMHYIYPIEVSLHIRSERFVADPFAGSGFPIRTEPNPVSLPPNTKACAGHIGTCSDVIRRSLEPPTNLQIKAEEQD